MLSLKPPGSKTSSSAPKCESSENEEEDDYMLMNFSEPAQREPETSIQRRARKQRDAETKSRQLSKADREAQDNAIREAALATHLDSSNKGFQMMAKLGFKGGALGKDNKDGRIEPIELAMKEDRGGIGLDSERKRKFREEIESVEKRFKAEEGDYRDRVRREREEKRLGAQIIDAMKVAERLDIAAEEDATRDRGGTDLTQSKPESGLHEKSTRFNSYKYSKPLTGIPVMWRSLVRHRLEVERERRMRYDLHQSLSRLPDYTDPEADSDDKLALAEEEEEIEEEDMELNEFNELEPEVRLAKIVAYLREKHWYCLWCKSKYDDENLSGCPGLTEDDHD